MGQVHDTISDVHRNGGRNWRWVTEVYHNSGSLPTGRLVGILVVEVAGNMMEAPVAARRRVVGKFAEGTAPPPVGDSVDRVGQMGLRA